MTYVRKCRVPLMFQSVRQDSSFGVKGKSGFLSSLISRFGPHLKVSWGTLCSSQIVAGNSDFLSSANRYLKEPLEWHKGNQTSFCISRGNSGLLSRSCRGKGPLLKLGGVDLVFPKLQCEA